MYFNSCRSFKHAFNIVPSKNLTYSNKTLFIPTQWYTLQHEDLFSRNLIPCTLTLFGQNSATLSPLSTSILKKAGVAWPRPCPQDCARAQPMTRPRTLPKKKILKRQRRHRPLLLWRKPQRCPPMNRRPQEAAAKPPAAKGGGRRAALLT